MGYMTAQGLLKTLLLTVTGFNSTDVTEGDYRVLDKNPTYAAVLTPGALPEIDLAGMVRSFAYEGVIDLFTRFVDDTSYSTFGTFRDLVIDKLNDNPALSDTYFMMTLRSDGGMEEVFFKDGGGPFFLVQRLTVTIEEQI